MFILQKKNTFSLKIPERLPLALIRHFRGTTKTQIRAHSDFFTIYNIIYYDFSLVSLETHSRWRFLRRVQNFLFCGRPYFSVILSNLTPWLRGWHTLDNLFFNVMSIIISGYPSEVWLILIENCYFYQFWGFFHISIVYL